MQKERVLFDKTEVTMAVVVGKNVQVVHLTYDRINSVTLEPYTARTLFRKTSSERIPVRASGQAEPYVLEAPREGKYFEGYKEGFRRFCRENRITLYDKLS